MGSSNILFWCLLLMLAGLLLWVYPRIGSLAASLIDGGKGDLLPGRIPGYATSKYHEVSKRLQEEIEEIFHGRGLGVQRLMTTALETVRPDAPVEEVAELMVRYKVRHVAVCPKYGELVGLINDRDLRNPDGPLAKDVMTTETFSVPPTTPVSEAVGIMLNEGVNCLPVIRGKHLCGLLTSADVLVGMTCVLDIMRQVGKELQQGSAS